MTTWTNKPQNSPSTQGFILNIGGFALLVATGYELLVGGSSGTGWSLTNANTTTFSSPSSNTTSWTNINQS